MNGDGDAVLETGIEFVDRELRGGIPMGSVVALSATPASQSELFLYELAATRPTVYCSTIRPEETVRGVIEEYGAGDVEVVTVGEEAPLADASELVADHPEGTNLMVDPVGVLETRDPDRYRSFLADLARRAAETDAVVFLHCLRGDRTPASRRHTVHAADLVFHLETETRSDSVVNRLTVPKFRGGESIAQVVKLDLTREVEVDMSRTIT